MNIYIGNYLEWERLENLCFLNSTNSLWKYAKVVDRVQIYELLNNSAVMKQAVHSTHVLLLDVLSLCVFLLILLFLLFYSFALIFALIHTPRLHQHSIMKTALLRFLFVASQLCCVVHVLQPGLLLPCCLCVMLVMTLVFASYQLARTAPVLHLKLALHRFLFVCQLLWQVLPFFTLRANLRFLACSILCFVELIYSALYLAFALLLMLLSMPMICYASLACVPVLTSQF